MKKPPVKINANLMYCLQFLRNAGERLRAIGLCMTFTKMSVFEASKFVDSLKDRAPLNSNRGQKKHCRYCNIELDIKTPKCPICKAVDLQTKPEGKTLCEVFAEEETAKKRPKRKWGEYIPEDLRKELPVSPHRGL